MLMPETNPVTGAINHVRLVVKAIADGRIEARQVEGMTDEQLDDYIARLLGEAKDEIAEGYAKHEPPA